MLIMFVVSAVLSMGFGAPAGWSLALACLLLSAFVLYSEIIQVFVKNLILFLACHVLGIVGVAKAVAYVYTSSEAIRALEIGGVQIYKVFIVLWSIFMLVVTILGIYTRVDGKGRFNPEIAEALLFVALLFFCRITRVREAESVIIVGELIWGILAVLYYNAKQVMGALVTYHDGDFVPYDQIRKNNSTMMRISLAVAVVMMLLCTVLDYGKELLAAIKSVIVSFLRWLFSHVSYEAVEETEILSPETHNGGFGMLLPEDYVDDSIWHKIWDALFWIAAAAVTVLAIYLFVKLIQQFYKLFNGSGIGIRERLGRDKKEFLSPLKNENEGAFGRRNENSVSFMDRISKRGRIRLLFVKYVEKGRNFADIKSSNTPSEIERISLERDAAAYELYEKARYSSNEITATDLNRMKSISKRS